MLMSFWRCQKWLPFGEIINLSFIHDDSTQPLAECIFNMWTIYLGMGICIINIRRSHILFISNLYLFIWDLRTATMEYQYWNGLMNIMVFRWMGQQLLHGSRKITMFYVTRRLGHFEQYGLKKNHSPWNVCKYLYPCSSSEEAKRLSEFLVSSLQMNPKIILGQW